MMLKIRAEELDDIFKNQRSNSDFSQHKCQLKTKMTNFFFRFNTLTAIDITLDLYFSCLFISSIWSVSWWCIKSYLSFCYDILFMNQFESARNSSEKLFTAPFLYFMCAYNVNARICAQIEMWTKCRFYDFGSWRHCFQKIRF